MLDILIGFGPLTVLISQRDLPKRNNIKKKKSSQEKCKSKPKEKSSLLLERV